MFAIGKSIMRSVFAADAFAAREQRLCDEVTVNKGRFLKFGAGR